MGKKADSFTFKERCEVAKTVVVQITVLDKVESSGNGCEIILAKPAAAFGDLTKPLTET